MTTSDYTGKPVPQGPATWPPSRAWPQAVHAGVAQLKDVIARWDLRIDQHSRPVLVAVSGGADSLALAVLAAETQRVTGIRFGAVVFDHQLQGVTAAVAQRTAELCTRLGLDPVVREDLTVTPATEGLEAAARRARYDAFVRCAHRHHAAGVLTAHTANDQAEQVLLGLARGSGARSIAGIRQDREHHLPGYDPVRIGRPLLGLTRSDTETICAWAGIEYFEDPMNEDATIARIRVRKHLLPALADPATGLGPGVFSGLVTTATLAADDADLLDAQAAEAFEAMAHIEGDRISFQLETLQTSHPAILRRVLALAVQHFGAPQPSFERLRSLQELIFPPVGRASSAGPIQLEGHLSAYRQKAEQEYAKLLVITSQPRN
ncbi:hypothetical protein GCM10023190_21050 [Enteractinococcus fodinae]|uniref:tRNA(Ile)-lysidine synthase n=1 Tax=Enteractinococcus fodinae TaxID=684663 RepID=A0ABU2B4E6_9MICC|nr:tRNA lysidine(34) synthetase TilS [Enteractinococcus fodinae]MDR7348136.1 tRNA(Ile)-lysidine synthase [Enteractinococcus fodinae]